MRMEQAAGGALLQGSEGQRQAKEDGLQQDNGCARGNINVVAKVHAHKSGQSAA